MSGDAERNIIFRPGLIGWGENMPSESSLSHLSSTECITQISNGWSYLAVVCASGRVYTLGNLSCHGWMKDTIVEPTLVRDLIEYKIIQAACSGDHSTFFVTDQGQLFSCGNNSTGLLGQGNTTGCLTPVLVRGLPCVKMVAAGMEHTVVVTESGEVWACGRNVDGQLGLGNHTDTNTFTRVSDVTERIAEASCGISFTALLTVSGKLLMTGSNRCYQLGQSDLSSSPKFLSIYLPSITIAAVTCGYCHTVALALDGSVWAWGWNSDHQLGVGCTTDHKSLPRRVGGLEGYTISSVFAGYGHTAFVTHQGDVLVCGHGMSGELGQGRKNISTPTLLKKLPGLRVNAVGFTDNDTMLNVIHEPRTIPFEINKPTECETTKTVSAEQRTECEMTVSVGQQTDCETTNLPTDLERTILTALECGVCFLTMSSPIQLCCNGHTVCGSCYSSPEVRVCPTCRGDLVSTRNTGLEYISSQVELPCFLCLRRMPVDALNSHDEVCPRRPYRCPMEQVCGWSGCLEFMLDHVCSEHPEKTCLHVPHTFSHDLEDTEIHTDLLELDGELFVFGRVSMGEDVLFCVQYIGQPEMATKFKFRVFFNFDNEDWSQTVSSNVCSLSRDIVGLLESQVAVSLRKDAVKRYLQNNAMPCRLNVLKTE